MRNPWCFINCFDIFIKLCSRFGEPVEREMLCLFVFILSPLFEGLPALCYILKI